MIRNAFACFDDDSSGDIHEDRYGISEGEGRWRDIPGGAQNASICGGGH